MVWVAVKRLLIKKLEIGRVKKFCAGFSALKLLNVVEYQILGLLSVLIMNK